MTIDNNDNDNDNNNNHYCYDHVREYNFGYVIVSRVGV